MVKSKNSGKGISFTFFLLAALLSAIALFVLQGMTTYVSDDYYYSLFFQDGLRAFVEKNIEHFQVRNGRVIVHLIAEIYLAGGMWFYAVCNTIVIAVTLALFLQYQRGEERITAQEWAFGAACSGISLLIMNYRVLKAGILCVSFGCNYFLPFFFIGCLLFFLRRAEQKASVWRVILVMFSALLSGATTEWGGCVAFGIVFLHFLRKLIYEKRCNIPALLALPLVLAGIVTILASPATQTRVDAELSFTGLSVTFKQYATNFAAPGMSLNLMILFCVILGLYPLLGKASKWLCMGLPIGAFLLSGYILPHNVTWNLWAFAVFCCYILLASFLMIFTFSGVDTTSGYLLLAGLGTAILFMFSKSVTTRTTLPFVFILIFVLVHILVKTYQFVLSRSQERSDSCKKLRLIASIGALFVLCGVLLWQVPMFRGIYHNYGVLKRNDQAIERARTTGELYYEDYEPFYCQQMLFSHIVPWSHFVEHYQIGWVNIHCHYEPGFPVIINKTVMETITFHGKQYVKLEPMLSTCGGKIDYVADNYDVLTLNGESYIYHAPYLYTKDENIQVEYDIIPYSDWTWISIDLVRDVFQINVSTSS